MALLLAGCGSQSGKTVMTQGPNAEPVMGTAPQSGTYKLYTAFSPNATYTVKLKEGDPLGFRRTSSGQIEAVGGNETQVLPKGTTQAYWKLQK
jgi:hypothetical protein